eukprot:COSAG05_NODE_407_length_10145_cov_234.042604_1_plen_106_part_10
MHGQYIIPLGCPEGMLGASRMDGGGGGGGGVGRLAPPPPPTEATRPALPPSPSQCISSLPLSLSLSLSLSHSGVHIHLGQGYQKNIWQNPRLTDRMPHAARARQHN